MAIDIGKVIDSSAFSFKKEIFLSIHASPVRFLGWTIDYLCLTKILVDRQIFS